jgi:pimeloyl-ACP methyl ester carboxylesterase
MPKVTIAGHDLFYVHRTSAEGDPSLLFIHGAGGTHRHWGHQLQGLKGANRYAVDLPGHDGSAAGGQASIAGYAQVIVELLDALHLDRATLVGHSMGGAISQYLALEHPQRVERLVLVGTGARLRVLPILLEGLLQHFGSTVEMMLDWAYSSNCSSEIRQLGRKEWLENEPSVVHGDFAACDNFDVMGKLGKISCPALVLCGEDDMLTPPKYAHYLQDSIPGASLSIIPEAGHMVMVEQPELVNRAIAEFLTATEGKGNHAFLRRLGNYGGGSRSKSTP